MVLLAVVHGILEGPLWVGIAPMDPFCSQHGIGHT